MSMDSSLKIKGALSRHRNVLSRAERIAQLQAEERWEEDDVVLSLDEELHAAVVAGERRHKLQSITLKLDPVQVQAIKKLATMKSMPYQTLIRSWLAEDLKKELHLAIA